jgi:hypothetical protein
LSENLGKLLAASTLFVDSVRFFVKMAPIYPK